MIRWINLQIITNLHHLVNHNFHLEKTLVNHVFTGALLKACFVLTKAVDLDSNDDLKEQLISKFKGGFELHAWANLPRGSGMGTSSILAGTSFLCTFKA